MTVSYEWGPDETAWTVIGEVFALPIKPVPGLARSGRAFAGRNLLKWALIVLAAIGFALGIAIYWLFALFPAGSYVFLRILTAPIFVAVYAVKGVTRLRPVRADREDAAATGRTGPAAAPPPRRSTPRPGTSPG